MTLDEIVLSTEDFLTPGDVAPVIGCKPYAINGQAQQDAAKLGFPVCVLGTRVKIPRLAFLHWIQFGNAPVTPEALRPRARVENSKGDEAT